MILKVQKSFQMEWIQIHFYPEYKSKKDQIIYAGNVGHAQDLESCILAIKKIIKYKDIKLIIVGDGDIRKDLEDLVVQENLEDYVIFTGLINRSKIPEMIAESLIGLAPLKKLECLDYAAPTKIFEYMGCGIPFLGCGIGEIERLAKESNAGIIADNDPDSIANSIINLIDNPKKSKEMGDNGIKYVEKYYNRKIISLNLYNQIKELYIQVVPTSDDSIEIIDSIELNDSKISK